MQAAGEGRPLRVRDLMTLEPLTVRDNTPLVRADRLMRVSGVSGLPVVDGEGSLVGVLSRTDLMRVAGGSGNEAWHGISVANTMTAPGLTVEADAPLAEARRPHGGASRSPPGHRRHEARPSDRHPVDDGSCARRCGWGSASSIWEQGEGQCRVRSRVSGRSS